MPTPEPSSRGDALALLRDAVDDTSATFRDGQWEAIDALVSARRRLLVVERTGWGKSSVYFIATRLLRESGRGPALIVSPLLALMRNQIDSAQRHRVRAVRIDSTNKADWPEIEALVHGGEADALLVSPERLANDEFVDGVLMPIADSLGLLVIDEAHCISDWGHDFRPDYQRLRNIVRRIPQGTPVLATTATANDRVVQDVSEQLGDVHVQRGPLTRESLALQTLALPSQDARLAWLSEHLPQLPGTGIIYALTKRDADRVADWLVESGIEARAYYSDVVHPNFENSDAYRQRLERALHRNELKALVATTALGMGYDKPDLGFVIHFQAPGSIVAYYQQVGRAGRQIDHAFGIMMHSAEDDAILEYFRRTAFPDEEHVRAILSALEESDGLSERNLERMVNLRSGQIKQALRFLAAANPAPVVKEGSTWLRTPAPYVVDREHVNRLTRQRETEWAEVKRYVNEPGCLMRFLRRALDDPAEDACGKCASCLGRPIVGETFGRDLAGAARHLRTSEEPIKPKKQITPQAFEIYGWNGLSEDLQHEEGRVLSRWGDAPWGAMVKQDKHQGRFRRELAVALADMVQQRWQPQPEPKWVACVPSLRAPALVPGLARRLAERLDVPFCAVVAKVRSNEPQKNQHNRYRQCRNLDGAFEIVGDVPSSPALLLDDVFDSGWTLAVVAALLRQAGSGPVFPVALASAAPGD